MRNAANIITVQNHKIHKNQPERTYTYTVLKLTVKQVIQSLHNGQSRKTLNYGSQTFCRAIQLGGSVPVLLAYVSVFANKTEKLFLTSISPLKFAVTLRSGSNRQARLEPCHRNPEILKSVLNRIHASWTHASCKTTRIWEFLQPRKKNVPPSY